MREAPVVRTAAGPVRGFWREDPAPSAAFLGIPFAKPPVGDLRFAAPEPPEPWTEVRDATAHGATPLRVEGDDTLIPEPAIPGDATLSLDVFTPSTQGSLPVMVWIHGGAYVEGSPASPWYDGSRFNRDGVVTVSVSYRLGFDGFGFLPGAAHNRGVRDWLAALEWVQENIAAFGGDPSQVTIAGQSAGGGAVLTLLGMPSAQHLFHRAISLSGALGDVPLDTARERGRRLAELAGVAADAAAVRTVPEAVLHDLQRRAGMTRRGLGAVVDLLDGLPWAPMIDGELLEQPTVASLQAGVGADKPLLLGSVDDEFTMILDSRRSALALIPAALALTPFLAPASVRRAYLAANRPQRAKGTAATVGRFISDQVFRSVVPRVAEARASAASGTWAYAFGWVSPTKGWACHCLDVPFWFDGLDRERVTALAGDAAPQALADEMHAAAVSFITAGDPGWPVWRTEPGTTRVFGGTGPALSTTAYDSTLALV